MDDDKTYYIMIRTPVAHYDSSPYIYGWSDSKSVVKAFMKQRSKKKYKIQKATADEIGKMFGHNDLIEDLKIDYLKLRSSINGEKYTLFMTLNEKIEAESKIQRILRDLCSLSNIYVKDPKKDTMYYLHLFLHIKSQYAEALECIGYHPKEIDTLFASAEDDSHVFQRYNYYHNISDGGYFDYSLEAFVRAMREDM